MAVFKTREDILDKSDDLFSKYGINNLLDNQEKNKNNKKEKNKDKKKGEK